jgi:ferric-dicitrate binding protein FerR (iron transport regulator)
MLLENSYQKNDGYSVEDLLQDDSFIASRLFPTQELDEYWNEILEKGTVSRDNYDLACRFIRSVHVQPEPFSDMDMLNLWDNIEVTNKKKLQDKKRRLHIFSVISSLVAAFAFLLWITNMSLPTNDEISSAEFHQLLVPWGKRSMITFGDGSRIWVNAGTQVTYPVVFDRKKREIYVDGEIYAEVSPDHTRPFIVKTKKIDVEVLGTAFNLSAYEKDSVQNIVLVSGSVKIHNADRKNKIVLEPNEMYSYGNGISLVQIVNVGEYISWKSGIYQYRSECLETIMKHLSHYYGCSIVCSPRASQLKFSGKLDIKDKLDVILEGISQTSPITYRYDKGVYIITNK